MNENNEKNNGLQKSDLENSIPFLQKQKLQIEERINKYQFIWWAWILAFFIGGLLGYSFSALMMISYSPETYFEFIQRKIPYSMIGGLIGCFTYAYFTVMYSSLLRGKLRRLEIKLMQLGVEKLQEDTEENFFTTLVQINFRYLDRYYDQTQEQANKSFKLSCAASIVGFLIIISGIIMMFLDKISPAYITTGSGLISEFIAAIFFYLYNRTVLKMSQYHQKLVLTQNISLALKITEDMDSAEQNKSKAIIIDRLTTDINKYLSGIND